VACSECEISLSKVFLCDGLSVFNSQSLDNVMSICMMLLVDVNLMMINVDHFLRSISHSRMLGQINQGSIFVCIPSHESCKLYITTWEH
jgi:hypothetical protein